MWLRGTGYRVKKIVNRGDNKSRKSATRVTRGHKNTSRARAATHADPGRAHALPALGVWVGVVKKGGDVVEVPLKKKRLGRFFLCFCQKDRRCAITRRPCRPATFSRFAAAASNEGQGGGGRPRTRPSGAGTRNGAEAANSARGAFWTRNRNAFSPSPPPLPPRTLRHTTA